VSSYHPAHLGISIQIFLCDIPKIQKIVGAWKLHSKYILFSMAENSHLGLGNNDRIKNELNYS